MLENDKMQSLIKDFVSQINTNDIVKCIEENKIEYFKFIISCIKNPKNSLMEEIKYE